jgi:hypothetical protein
MGPRGGEAIRVYVEAFDALGSQARERKKGIETRIETGHRAL